MNFSRSFIPLVTAASLSIATPSLEAKPKKVVENTEAKVVSLLASEEAEKYLPKPTLVPRADFLERIAPLAVDIPQGDMSRIFRSARDYMDKTYQKPKSLERITIKTGKDTVTWEAIPYIVAEQKFIQSDPTKDALLIHMLRQKLPDGRLGTWRGPVESTAFSVEIVGPSKYAKTLDDALREKSLGAGTHFQIKSPDGTSYVVLATRYPQQGGTAVNIQTPYSSRGLAMPEVIKKGKEYLSSLKKQAQDDIISVSWNSRELQEYGSTMVEILGLVENINPTHLHLPERYKKQIFDYEIEKVFALLGANEERAFRRPSHAGANGLMQIIGPTFARLQTLYPSALFASGYTSSTSDHRISILAAKAHIEMEWSEYKKRPKLYEWLTGAGKLYVPYILAAGYNSNNFHRALELERIIISHPTWKPAQIIREFYYKLHMPRGNPDETRAYMQKVEAVMRALGLSYGELPLYDTPSK